MAQVETLMLANHAESLNGLLYIHGGGWSHHWRGQVAGSQDPAPSQFAIATTFLLDAGETGRPHAFVVRVASDRGEEVLRAEGSLDGGTPGSAEAPFRTGVALNASVPFPHEGTYTLTAEIDGRGGAAVVFWVHDSAPGAAQPPSGADSGTTSGYL